MDDNKFLLMDRIQKIQSVINKYGEENFYISFSGGKDSTVLHHLIDEAVPGNKIPRVYFNTGIEFQMVQDFVRGLAETDERFEIIKPQTPIRKMLEKEGYPFKSKEHSQRLHEFQNRGTHTNTTYNYMMCEGSYAARAKFGCPKSLRFQFDTNYPLKVSHKCCARLKKDIGNRYMKDHNITWNITGMTRAEGGARTRINCVNYSKGRGKFHPMAPVSEEWVNWYIERNNIQLCELYYPPFNFDRTGCKGCPYNIHLQEELDLLEKYLPAERKQCEIIWGPVYEEYRKLGYRLRQPEKYKQIDGQMTLDEWMEASNAPDE
jgi:3'-phosphoadenosine 5'-phosphosulfate sulfotransferase (PAPS reductase)/FAD synthetase